MDGNVEERHLPGCGPIRLLAAAEGFVMVRRESYEPFVLSEREWLALAVVRTAGKVRAG
jgi:hypothetical protein